MFPIPFYVALLVSFPEVLVTLMLGFYLTNFKNVSIYKVLVIALIQTTLNFFIRQTSIHFGIHTIILMLTLTVLVNLIIRIQFMKAAVSVMIGSLVQGVIQSLTLFFLNTYCFNITQIPEHPMYNIVSFIPILIISLVLLFVLKKTNFIIYDMNS